MTTALIVIVFCTTFAVSHWLVRRIVTGRCRAAERRTRAMANLLADRDRALADWCRHMSLTVVTHTGSVFSATLAELNASEASDFRNWNVPIQITLWSDLDDDARPEILNA